MNERPSVGSIASARDVPSPQTFTLDGTPAVQASRTMVGSSSACMTPTACAP